MHLSAKVWKINIWDLFIHDCYDCGPYCPGSVAKALEACLNEGLAESQSRVKVVPPEDSGLSRFTLSLFSYGDPCEERITNRMYTSKEVKRVFPKWVVQKLDALNKKGLVLGQ